MRLETENSLFPEGFTEGDLLGVLDDDRARGGFLILTADDGRFLQAAGQGWSPYTIEFFPEKNAKLYQQATNVNKDQIRSAFIDFLHGGSAWQSSFDWRQVDETKRSGRSLFVVVGIVLVLLLGYYLLSRGV